MRTARLSTCLAALALAACGSTAARHPPEVSEPTPVLTEAPRVTVASVVPQELARVEALALPTQTPPPIPTEDLLPAEPADGLALAHETHLVPVDHLARARTLRQEGDLAGALTEARRAVHDAAEDPDALEKALDTLISLARLTHQKPLAVEAYAQLAQLFPEGPEPLVQQARLLLELGDTEGAFRAAEAALELDPEYPEVYQVLGRAHLAAGQLSEAIIRFQQVVHLDPYHGYALNNLGLALLESGQDTQAAEALAQAAYLLPHEGFVHNNLGLAYERLGRYPEALMAYDTAARLAPGNTHARLNRTRLQHELQASAEVPAHPEDPTPRAPLLR